MKVKIFYRRWKAARKVRGMVSWHNLFDSIKIIGLLSIPFTLYFGWMKIGYRVAATYSWSAGRLADNGISSVTIINLKDRPLAIFDIHAVANGLSFGLKEFDPPLILKALEATTISIDIVSERYVGNNCYDWSQNLEEQGKIEIYLSTFKKQIKCLQRSPKSRIGFAIKKGLGVVTTRTSKFNGIIYNKDAKYAITYTLHGEQKTALIDVGGLIYWNISPNGLNIIDLRSSETVKTALVACGVAMLIEPFVVDELHKSPESSSSKRASYRKTI